MNPQSILIRCFCLLNLLILIRHFSGEEAFLWNHTRFQKKDNMFRWSKNPKFEHLCLLVPLPFLLLTFVVYSILPELQNMHGYTLRVHVASLFVTNVIKFCTEEFTIILSTRNICLPFAYILIFSTLSSLFWLNVICFDTWLTLRQSRSYRTNLKKREKKMFIMYSIFAWGISFVLIVVYAILDVTHSLIIYTYMPAICRNWVWLTYSGFVYFYVPVGVSVIVNICFFVAITLKIWNHGKQTTNQLRNSRSSHDNKNRFTIYVTLSAILGISWILKIIMWMSGSFEDIYQGEKNLGPVLWHIAEITDIFQGVILYFAFVHKKKIKVLLLKRIGWHNHDPDNSSRNNNRPSTCSNTVTLTSISSNVSLQEISFSNQQINYHVESYS